MSRPAVDVRALRDGDIEQLLADMRPADWQECSALVGDVGAAVRQGCAASTLLWVAESGGRVLAIFGVVPRTLMGDEGIAWLLGTNAMDGHRRALNRLAPSYIARMLTLYPRLLNVVDARNTRAIRWLRAMGFEVLDPVPCGIAGQPFHPFFLEAA